MTDKAPRSLRLSEEFPSGTGDFQLISSDHVSFYCHKWLLAYMSPIFSDMFALGVAGAPQELTVPEDSATLDFFLRFVDPKKKNPALEFDDLPKLLELARKYQLDDVTEWVKQWISENPATIMEKMDSVSTSRAAEILDLGTVYDVPNLSRYALRVLIKASMTALATSSAPTSPLYAHLMKLRAERIELLQKESKNSVLAGHAVPTDRITLCSPTEIATIVSAAFKLADQPDAKFALLDDDQRQRFLSLEASLPSLPQ